MSLNYKFLPLETALLVLESRRLKISRVAELNDILDCLPIIAAPLDKPEYTDQQWTDRIVNQNSRNYGLLCLSRTFRSPLLWGHYAANAAGLALGFDPAAFPWANPIQVEYRDLRPSFSWKAADDQGETFVEDMLRCSFGVKSLEWAYEQEVRYVLALDTCQTAEGRYFAPFPSNALKQIIVGFRSNLDRSYLTRFLKQQYPAQTVDVRDSHCHATKYELELDEPPT